MASFLLLIFQEFQSDVCPDSIPRPTFGSLNPEFLNIPEKIKYETSTSIGITDLSKDTNSVRLKNKYVLFLLIFYTLIFIFSHYS